MCVCVESAENRGLLTSLQSGLRWTLKFAVCVKLSCPGKVESWPIYANLRCSMQKRSLYFAWYDSSSPIWVWNLHHVSGKSAEGKMKEKPVDWSPRSDKPMSFPGALNPQKYQSLDHSKYRWNTHGNLLAGGLKKGNCSTPRLTTVTTVHQLCRLRLADA